MVIETEQRGLLCLAHSAMHHTGKSKTQITRLHVAKLINLNRELIILVMITVERLDPFSM